MGSDGSEGAKFWLAVLTKLKNRGVANLHRMAAAHWSGPAPVTACSTNCACTHLTYRVGRA